MVTTRQTLALLALVAHIYALPANSLARRALDDGGCTACISQPAPSSKDDMGMFGPIDQSMVQRSTPAGGMTTGEGKDTLYWKRQSGGEQYSGQTGESSWDPQAAKSEELKAKNDYANSMVEGQVESAMMAKAGQIMPFAMAQAGLRKRAGPQDGQTDGGVYDVERLSMNKEAHVASLKSTMDADEMPPYDPATDPSQAMVDPAMVTDPSQATGTLYRKRQFDDFGIIGPPAPETPGGVVDVERLSMNKEAHVASLKATMDQDEMPPPPPLGLEDAGAALTPTTQAIKRDDSYYPELPDSKDLYQQQLTDTKLGAKLTAQQYKAMYGETPKAPDQNSGATTTGTALMYGQDMRKRQEPMTEEQKNCVENSKQLMASGGWAGKGSPCDSLFPERQQFMKRHHDDESQHRRRDLLGDKDCSYAGWKGIGPPPGCDGPKNPITAMTKENEDPLKLSETEFDQPIITKRFVEPGLGLVESPEQKKQDKILEKLNAKGMDNGFQTQVMRREAPEPTFSPKYQYAGGRPILP